MSPVPGTELDLGIQWVCKKGHGITERSSLQPPSLPPESAFEPKSPASRCVAKQPGLHLGGKQNDSSHMTAMLGH